ncbi:hypothetical protein, partial [Aeromonas caviae]|uniref:hypothetical protein n=1 Tax=Aeromonas caviae TaxID=648 RepID=UPI00301567C6
MTSIIHAEKRHRIDMICRKTGLFRGYHEAFLGDSGKHAAPLCWSITEVVHSTCILRIYRNLNPIIYGITDSCFDWRSFCCALSSPRWRHKGAGDARLG